MNSTMSLDDRKMVENLDKTVATWLRGNQYTYLLKNFLVTDDFKEAAKRTSNMFQGKEKSTLGAPVSKFDQ